MTIPGRMIREVRHGVIILRRNQILTIIQSTDNHRQVFMKN